MLRVKTYLAPSGTHGIGLFLAEPVKAGTIVWEYDSTKDIFVNLGEDSLYNEFVEHYGFLTNDGWIMCGDNARFMNHSENPNLISDSHNRDIAKYDMMTGTELTCDYREFDLSYERKFSR